MRLLSIFAKSLPALALILVGCRSAVVLEYEGHALEVGDGLYTVAYDGDSFASVREEVLKDGIDKCSFLSGKFLLVSEMHDGSPVGSAFVYKFVGGSSNKTQHTVAITFRCVPNA